MNAPPNMPPADKTITLGGKVCRECGAIDETALLDGAVEERFQLALAAVLENINDPNTDPEKARTITIKVVFAPDKERRRCAVIVDVNEKLVGLDGLATDIYLGRHEGKLAVVEGPRQEKLFENPEPAKPRSVERTA